MEHPKNITLTVTNRCNLSCVYCYEHYKDTVDMTLDTAKKIVSYHLSRSDGGNQPIRIQFFGGEPFLRFDLIRAIYDFIDNLRWPNKYTFLATTNGTLINREIKEWLSERRNNFICGLSLDGAKPSHDVNRCNSFDLIDIDFFINTWKNYPIKMTVSPFTVGNLNYDIRYLHSIGASIKCNFAVGVDWSNSKLSNLLREQLLALIDFYTVQSTLPLCSLLDINLSLLGYPSSDDIISKFCGVGTSMIAYDVLGNSYPCQFFTPVTLSEHYRNQVEALTFQSQYSISELDDDCQSCPFIRVCSNCYGANFQLSHNIYSKDHSFCEMAKMLVVASAIIQYRRYQSSTLSLKNELQELQFLKGIDIALKFEYILYN